MNDLPYQHQTLIIEEFEPDVFRLLFTISFISMNGNFGCWQKNLSIIWSFASSFPVWQLCHYFREVFPFWGMYMYVYVCNRTPAPFCERCIKYQIWFKTPSYVHESFCVFQHIYRSIYFLTKTKRKAKKRRF